jgi:hypothetical protein
MIPVFFSCLIRETTPYCFIRHPQSTIKAKSRPNRADEISTTLQSKMNFKEWKKCKSSWFRINPFSFTPFLHSNGMTFYHSRRISDYSLCLRNNKWSRKQKIFHCTISYQHIFTQTNTCLKSQDASQFTIVKHTLKVI